MDHNFTDAEKENIKLVGRDFEMWLNQHIEAGHMTVYGLVNLLGLTYMRLRTTLTVDELEDLVSAQFILMEQMLQEGLTVKMGPELDEMVRMPTVEDYVANPGLREMYLALNNHPDLDTELDELLDEDTPTTSN